MKINIYDVAKKAGLSTVTVSRVINNSSRVREYNKQKVLQAMEELGYHPNAAARSLARGKTGVIGLLLPTLNDTFFNEVVRLLNQHLETTGYFLAISILSYDREGNARGTDFLFQEQRVDGIILLSPLDENVYLWQLKKKNIPFILLDNQIIHPSATQILVDNYQGGYDVTRHLLDLGHRSIGFIGASRVYLSSIEREKGFREALRERGIQPLGLEWGRFDFGTGYRITKRWLEEGKLPTAIFAADDHIAFGAINALQEAGLKVPGDISVAGYDDSLFSSCFRPTLTTVRQPAEEMSKKCVELLIQIIDNKLQQNPILKLKPRLIIRQSTAAKT